MAKINSDIKKFIRKVIKVDKKISNEKRNLKIDVAQEAEKIVIIYEDTEEELFPFDTSLSCPPGENWEPAGYFPGKCV